MRQNNRLVSAATARAASLWISLGAVVGVAGILALAPTLRTDPKSDWLARARRSIEDREYHASANQVGLQAPNRAQNLRTYFEPTGIRVHDRTAPGSPELFALSLSGMGRAGKLTPLPPGEIGADGARVEIRREGVVEWYVNSKAGLEQGFTLAKRPPGAGPLVIELAVQGAKASMRDEVAMFSATSGRRLRYDHLVVADASGRALNARLSVPEPERVRILVDDAGAAYPVVIDPIIAGTADTQLESNLAGRELGSSVAGAGDVNGDGYDDVIVGAPFYDAGELYEGAAFVFLGSASGVADGNPGTAATQLESNQVGAELGSAVARAGDVNGDGYDDVIVSAPAYDAGETDEGAAFVFLGSVSGIADGNPATAATRLESNQAGARISAVAGAGDVNGDGYDDVIVGAYQYNAGEQNEGAAFVFLGSASGIPDGDPGTAATQLESNQAFAFLGSSVGGAGDVNGDGYDDVIVGATSYDAGETDEGAAFVFLGSASGIPDGDPGTAATQLESNQESAQLGVSVAGAGDVNGDGYDDLIVGAEGYDITLFGNEGAAFVFLGGPSGIADGTPGTAAAQLESAANASLFGSSVAGAGDVNGDGFSDVIVGARGYNAAFVFLGGASGIRSGDTTTAYAQLKSDQTYAGLGGIAGAGDVNGDGYADVIIGAPFYDAGQVDEGAAFVFLGEADGDADHVADSTDNCLTVANENQRDTNSDGYGNMCDADINNNGIVGAGEVTQFANGFGKCSGDSGFNPDLDRNGNGCISAGEVTWAASQFGLAPGPSGLACAGTIPCM